jgi:excisionase family DNA binding protein
MERPNQNQEHRNGNETTNPHGIVERFATLTAVLLPPPSRSPRLRIMTYEPLLNDLQAAQFLGGLHPKTVQRMAPRGEIPHYRVGKYYRYKLSELDQWLSAQRQTDENAKTSRASILEPERPPAQTRLNEQTVSARLPVPRTSQRWPRCLGV